MEKPSLQKKIVLLMKIATNEVEFSSNDTVFCQTDEKAMRSSLEST